MDTAKYKHASTRKNLQQSRRELDHSWLGLLGSQKFQAYSDATIFLKRMRIRVTKIPGTVKIIKHSHTAHALIIIISVIIKYRPGNALI